MAIPRRLDRRPPERDTTRINERIRVPQVRLVDENGAQVGVVDTSKALGMARDRDLDLVEVSPESRPPVAKLLDYSKYKYEQVQKAKAARKHQQQINVREIKLRPKIAVHDYATKKGHVERFLLREDKVKVTIMFRGREQAHPDRGRDLLNRLYEDVAELAIMESPPAQEGRNMHMMLAPSKEAIARNRRRVEEHAASTGKGRPVEEEAEAEAEAPADAAEPAADTPEPAADTPEPAAEAAADAPEPAAEAADSPPAED